MPNVLENRYPITIDFKNRTISNAKYKQGDTNSSVLEINLVNNGLPLDITGQDIEFNFLKPDGTTVVQDSTTGVSFIDALKGNFQCVLMNNTLASPGLVSCELTFKKDGRVLSTFTFNFVVEKSIGNGGGLLSSNYIGAIENILLIINEAETSRESAEVIRGTSEANRVINEDTRIAEESTRIVNETDRLSSEVIRKSDSEARIEAEIIRVNSEGLRIGNETVRLSAEDLRVISEVLRATNETDRTNRFNLLTTSQQQAAEVINARTSTIKAKTFASLTARIEEIEVDTSKESYSVELTQNANMFTLGKGKNSVGADIDVSSSVVSGIVKTSIEGNTSDIYTGGVKADFVGKIAGSVVENPNIFKPSLAKTSLDNPSTYVDTIYYENIDKLDGVCKSNITTISGIIPQHLFSFDIVKIYERKYGIIPSLTQSLADKVVWLKANITSILGNWHGYGSCPSGNKAFLEQWKGIWSGAPMTSNGSIPTKLIKTLNTTAQMEIYIDANGFVHYLAYTDMASTTSPTLLVLTGHELIAGDIVENVTRNSGLKYFGTGTITSANSLTTAYTTLQQAGDIVNKYRRYSSPLTALVGTTPTNLVINNHNLLVGDVISVGSQCSKVTVVIDVNTVTLDGLIGTLTTGTQNIYLAHYIGQQVAESTLIPSTIYTDYVSLDITLKPSYKSVGEDFKGVASKRIDALSRGKNLFNKSKFSIIGSRFNGGGSDNTTVDPIYNVTEFIRLKPNTTYYKSNFGASVSNLYDVNKVYSTATIAGSSGTFTTSATEVYFRGTILVANLDTIQLEEGTVATPYTPYVEDKRALVLANPLRRVSPTVADVYKEGQVIRNVSEWLELLGSLDWIASSPSIFPTFNETSVLISSSGIAGTDFVVKNDGTILTRGGNNVPNSSAYSVREYLRVLGTDTGFIPNMSYTSQEWKAYFYGYKMCHSDGVSTYQVSEVPYNPTTWAEWTKLGGVIGDSAGVEFISDGVSNKTAFMPTNLKPSTKYGYLYNVVNNNTAVGKFIIDGSSNQPFSNYALSLAIGNNKGISTSSPSIALNNFRFVLINTEPSGNKIKLKDIRLFELPVGSQIETDFNTLTADQLTAKYKFYGLNPKNWKSVVDGSGQTAVLPTTQAPNYTPYKMLYQKAVPTVEILNVESINPLEPSGVLPLASYEKGTMIVDGGSIIPTTKYSVPLNFKAMGMDNNALINSIKDYVLKLDSYTTNSLLSIADRELRMKAVVLLATETNADLKAKINELINIWKV